MSFFACHEQTDAGETAFIILKSLKTGYVKSSL